MDHNSRMTLTTTRDVVIACEGVKRLILGPFLREWELSLLYRMKDIFPGEVGEQSSLWVMFPTNHVALNEQSVDTKTKPF